MIELVGVSHGILRIERCDIPDGLTAVIGPNGSGKTTLLRLISGIASPTGGEIRIDGKPPDVRETGWMNEVPGRNILIGTVRDEIASPLRFRHLECRELDEQVRIVAGLSGIEALLKRPGSRLSGGEMALTGLCAAMAPGPHVLVLDEFDSHLDQGAADRVWGQILSGKARYTVFSTQDMERAAGADQIIFLREGRIHAAGTPEIVFSRVAEPCFRPLFREFS